MLPITDIQQYGGKAAILRYMNEKLPTMPIPRFVVKQASQGIDSVLAEFKSMKKPVTVRSSSPYEYADFEGIFDSVQEVYHEGNLRAAIQHVEQSAMSERARRYATIHGFTIDERIHTIIQEQSPSPLQGAMMRHPNNPDLIYITCFRGKGRYQQDYRGLVYNDRTGRKEKAAIAIDEKLELRDVKLLVENYKEIESLTEIGEEVLYVEFGLEPLAIYQARPFRKIQTAEFSLPNINSKNSLHTDLAFGITPPDGIVFPVLRSVGNVEISTAIDSACKKMLGEPARVHSYIKYGENEMDWVMDMINLWRMDIESSRTREFFARMMHGHHTQFEAENKEPYCLLTSSAKREDYDVDLTVPQMKALVIGQAQSFLTHGLMRLIKQAEVTFAFDSALVASDLYLKTKTKEDKIRIISNGKEAIAMRE